MKTYVTRVGWILGPALGIVGAVFWAANGWLLSSRNALYQLTSCLAPGAFLAAVACAILPGPRFEVSQAEMDRGMGRLIMIHARWWQLVVWVVAFVVGLVVGSQMPARFFAPWIR